MILAIVIAYLLCAAYASYVLTEGYRIDFTWSGIILFSLMWPFFAVILILTYIDEWEYRLRKSNEDECECTIATNTPPNQPASTAKASSDTPCGASPSTPTSSTPTTPS